MWYKKSIAAVLALFLILTIPFILGKKENDVRKKIVFVQGGDSQKPKETLAVTRYSITNSSDNSIVKTSSDIYFSEQLAFSRGRVLGDVKIDEEQKDSLWAKPTEEIISQILITIPYIDLSSLSVNCYMTLCSASGRTKNMGPEDQSDLIGNYIKNEQFMSDGIDMNALPKHSSYVKGENGGEFIIQFARVRR